MLNERQCIVCFYDFDRQAGIVCSNGHFLCKTCTQGFVRSVAEPDNISILNLNSGKVRCPGFSSDGGKCTCPGYSASALAQVLPEPLFELLETAKERAMEQRVSEQVREGHKAELKRLEEQAAALASRSTSNAQDRISRHREHVIEKLLTLRCPNPACEVAFVDFEGCMALKCNACRTGFCAFCLANCGVDAHAHVARCPERGSCTSRGYHATFQEFQDVQRRRRTGLVARYLDKIADNTERKSVLDSVSLELKDLQIDISTLRERSSGATGCPSNPSLSPRPHAAHGGRGRRIAARRFRGPAHGHWEQRLQGDYRADRPLVPPDPWPALTGLAGLLGDPAWHGGGNAGAGTGNLTAGIAGEPFGAGSWNPIESAFDQDIQRAIRESLQAPSPHRKTRHFTRKRSVPHPSPPRAATSRSAQQVEVIDLCENDIPRKLPRKATGMEIAGHPNATGVSTDDEVIVIGVSQHTGPTGFGHVSQGSLHLGSDEDPIVLD